jgi:hypothetical protein
MTNPVSLRAFQHTSAASSTSVPKKANLQLGIKKESNHNAQAMVLLFMVYEDRLVHEVECLQRHLAQRHLHPCSSIAIATSP